jgi:hypothetical protein
MSRMPRKLGPLFAAVTLSLASCVTSPLEPIPEPLPETLAWAVEGSGGGAFLGLKTRENDSGSLDELFFLPGVRVTQVIESSPAEQAGFRVGDVVLSIDRHELNDPAALETLLHSTPAGERIVLEVQRDDSVFEVPVELRAGKTGATGEARLQYRLDPSRSRAGWITGRGGAVLVCSDEGGPFPAAGVPLRSVIRSIDGEEVLSDRALIRLLQARAPGEEVEVSFTDPEGGEHEATVGLQEQPMRFTGFSIPILIDYSAEAEGHHTSFTLIDLWFLWLFHYEREGGERTWSFLRFIRGSAGVGELTE